MADGPGTLSQESRGEGRRDDGALRVRRRAAARPQLDAGTHVPVSRGGADGVEEVGAGVLADDAYAESFFVSFVGTFLSGWNLSVVSDGCQASITLYKFFF